MKEQVDNIEKTVNEIKVALLGNEYNDKGLVHRVKEVEDYQLKDKKQKWMIAGALALIGIIGRFWKEIWSS